MKYIIACIDNDLMMLDELYNKLSRIVDSDYIIESYINAEQALIGCFNDIIAGNEILITINGKNNSSLKYDEFLLELYKNSPNTKNIIFQDTIDIKSLEKVINEASVYKIIPRTLKRVDFELMILEAIKLNAQERRLKEYQKVLESAVDKRTKELNNINVKLNVLATTDSLTGVKNRRSFFESCGPMISYNRREKKSLSTLMIDIDKFKLINDNYSHKVGDEVIKLMAQTTQSLLRKSDVFGRLGGEEFGVVLPNTSLRGAKKVAEHIRSEIESLEFITSNKSKVKFTISIGVSVLTPNENDLNSLLHKADLALYEAKKNGRNRVEVYCEDIDNE
ncbi:GGDEF domain-containing protein [Arcobacter sp. YIC-80]|uniref:GGDEF domain-containing protein n=1 Tax=Arcobacter sp. YIC-80 TaxID=3376683 RepID=UPI003850C401